MLSALDPAHLLALFPALPAWLDSIYYFILVVIGFSAIIFVHELGHFLAAKWAGVRVDRFAVGFGPRLFGYRPGEGLTFGNRPDYTADELVERRYGETDYCFKALPIGGYVKMMGQDDIIIDEKTNEMRISDDPRAFPNRPVSKRMVVVSAGVVFNLLFAAFLLMIVFMLGVEMRAPVIGEVSPDSPAYGLLKTGDRVLSINGDEIDSWDDIAEHAAVASDALHMKIVRDGKELPEPVVVEPRYDPRLKFRVIDVGIPKTTRRTAAARAYGDHPAVQKGDVITHVDGAPVSDFSEIAERFMLSKGRPLTVTVQRPEPNNPEKTTVVECLHRAELLLLPTNVSDPRGSGHLLGLEPRCVVERVMPGEPAALAENLDGGPAGLMAGDVVLQAGGTPKPTFQELLDEIARSEGNTMDFVVQRGDQPVRMRATPRRDTGEKKWLVGTVFLPEVNSAVIADVVPESASTVLHLPRGAQIVAVQGQPIRDWFDLCEAFFANAGKKVTLRFRSGADEIDAKMQIPGSVVSELGLSQVGRIYEIDGVDKATVKDADGKSREGYLPDPYVVRELLKERIGKAVDIVYAPNLHEATRTAKFAVTAENVDPWQMRTVYLVFDASGFADAMELVSAGGNPLLAMQKGVRWLQLKVKQMYQLMAQIAQRRVSTQTMAGPVGIVSVAVERARAGPVELLLFLAFLSMNLAVINFLPLPVMDGGLMVFLLIEKIKGKPLGMKTQMITTLVGLAAIVLIFIAVTIQDVTRLIR